MPLRTATEEIVPVAPPALITTASFLGVAFQDWVYILTAAYAAVQLLRAVPKIIGCGRCFWINGTCKLTCKNNGSSE